MKKIVTVSLAALMALAGASVANAVDVKTGTQLDAGAAVGTDAGSTSVDATTTGTVSASGSAQGQPNFGSLISNLRTSADVDLSAYNDTSTVNCVKVSSLKGEAGADATALDNAISASGDQLATLRGNVQANADLMADIEASCGIADVSLEDILSIESGANGMFTVYIDDRA